MKLNYLPVSVLMACMFLQSCVTDLGYDNSKFQSKLVVNCLFNPEGEFDVHLTNSRNILDSESSISPVNGATIIVRNEGDKSEEILQEYKPGNYNSTFLTPEPGTKYTIEVHAEGFESVFASSRIPVITNNFVIDTAVVEIEGEEIFKVDIEFDDIEGTGNYYVWEMELMQGNERYLSGIKTTDLQTDQISSSSIKQTRIFLNDASFDGENYSTSFYSSEAIGSNESTTSEVRLFSVSKDMYNYYKTLELYENLNSNSNTNLSAPIDVYSNIEGGLGIFAGFNVNRYQFEIIH